MNTPLTPRRNWVGASEIAAIAGLSDFATPYKVWRQIFGLDEFPQTPQQSEGLALEPMLRQAYTDKFGVVVHPIEPVMHPTVEMLGASPDGLREDKLAPVELKTVGFRMNSKWGEEGTDEIPMDYLCQGQFQAGMLRLIGIEVHEIHWVKWYRETGASFYKAEFDPALFEILVEAGNEFIQNHVKTQEPPDVDGSDAAARAIKEKYPTHIEGQVIVADAVADEKVARLGELKAEGWAIEEEQTALENWLKMYIGDCEALDSQLGRFTFKKNKDGEKTDWQQVAMKLGASPALIAEFTKTTPGARVFRTPFTRSK